MRGLLCLSVVDHFPSQTRGFQCLCRISERLKCILTLPAHPVIECNILGLHGHPIPGTQTRSSRSPDSAEHQKLEQQPGPMQLQPANAEPPATKPMPFEKEPFTFT